MSYDLCLFRLPEGSDPVEVFTRLQQEEEQRALNLEEGPQRSLPESVRAEEQSIADSCKMCCPTFIQFQPEHPLPWIELDEENLQVQIMIQEDMVNITMPYFRERSTDMMDLVGKCIDKLTRTTGMVVFDPQLGRLVTAIDLSQMQTQYHDMDRHLPEILGQANKMKSTKQWWKFW